MASIDGKRSSSRTESDDDENGHDNGANYNQDDSNDHGAAHDSAQNGGQPSSKSKDPSRPKRKKARRACLACQRAHLTCGDERPCQRCVKRGLQDSCHDGVRKKAKYLHDAPNEALAPGIVEDYSSSASKKHSQSSKSKPPEANARVQSADFTSSNRSASLTQPPIPNPGHIPAEMQQNSQFNPYPNHQSPITPHYSSHQTSPMQNFSNPAQSQAPPSNLQGYGGQFFDPSDPLYNFDISGMDFGNQYGALEFGMLGQMSAANDGSFPPARHGRSSSNAFESPNLNTGFAESAADPSQFSPAHSHSMLNWQMSQPNQGLLLNAYNANMGGINTQYYHGSQNEPHAYAIGTGPNAYQAPSPTSQRSDPSSMQEQAYVGSGSRRSSRQQLVQRSPPEQRKTRQQQLNESGPIDSIAQKLHSMSSAPANSKKWRRNPSQVYSSVTKPYPYTLGFHALTAVLQRRFSSQKRLAIARALASIRPSFISCTRTLVDDDLIFMEKSFQRALLEYEDVVGAVGTPTIVCRRTGEVAYAGTEFSLLTGWSRDVLLGKEPNFNINNSWNGDAPSGTMSSNTSRGGFNTPRAPITSDPSAAGRVSPQLENRPQPVFLAELLDDDSVVQFYEDFAKLAFADKGSVWSPCKVVKYITKEDQLSSLSDSLEGTSTGVVGPDGATAKPTAVAGHAEAGAREPGALSPGDARNKRGSIVNGGGSTISFNKGGEPYTIDDQAMKKLRDRNSKVDCVYCWTVRRDFFNMPMMIVLNFLPIM